MDTQVQKSKLLPKIKLSLLSVNFLKQKDSTILLKYVEELYQSAQTQNKEHQQALTNLQSYKNKVNDLNITNQFLKEELKKTNHFKVQSQPVEKSSLNNANLIELEKETKQQKIIITKLQLKVKELDLIKLRHSTHIQTEEQNKSIFELKHKKYILKFKKKLRYLFKKYAEKITLQQEQLKKIQESSIEIQKLINSAQHNNHKLNKANQQLAHSNQQSEQSIAKLKTEITYLTTQNEEYIVQQKSVKTKTIQTLKSLEKEMQVIQTKNQHNQYTIQKKNEYINKIQNPLTDSKKQIIRLKKENLDLDNCSKLQLKQQNNLTVKLRQYQDIQEKLAQQNQSLQKLNKNISLSLNQCRHQIQQLKSNGNKAPYSKPENQTVNLPKIEKNQNSPISTVLAKLYSGYNTK